MPADLLPPNRQFALAVQREVVSSATELCLRWILYKRTVPNQPWKKDRGDSGSG